MSKILTTILFFSQILNAQQNSNHFIPVWNNNPFLPMNIYISSATVDTIPLEAGDEIGIFDEDICVGSKVLSSQIIPSNPLSIISATDDPLTPQRDGFTPGNPIKFKVWKSSAGKEILNCISEYQAGTGYFISQGTALANLNCFSVLKISPLKLLIEGLFNGIEMVSDTVTIELRNEINPYQILDQQKVIIDSTGQAIVEFDSLRIGKLFYIVIRHRNSIETWSKFPQVFNSGFIEYDFTNDSTKAYGNNLTLKSGKWCIYSGDVNQDGIIDSIDLNLVFSDNVNGVTGYVVTDLNGDGYVEIGDLIIVYLNSANEVNAVKPDQKYH